jgi:hypothetical protein
MMEEFDQVYPGYGFAQHKGYGTTRHISCLQKLGPSPIHRLYFAPVRDIIARKGSRALATAHSEPFPFWHPEPAPPCRSEARSSCHPEGVQRPKSLIQGKSSQGSGHEPPRNG